MIVKDPPNKTTQEKPKKAKNLAPKKRQVDLTGTVSQISKKEKDYRYRDEAFLREQYINEKKSLTQIAKMCDVHMTLVRNHMLKYNIPRRSKQEARKILKQRKRP